MTSEDNNAKVVCPESTLDSANRRNFMRRAAVGGAAVALAGTILGKSAAPESSASSDCCCGIFVKCNFVTWDCVVVDTKNQNDGSMNRCGRQGFCYDAVLGAGHYDCPVHALTFGVSQTDVLCNGHVAYTLSGEGIASARTCGAANHHGLDFYTDFTKRVSITNSGKVGIATCAPTATLCVHGQGAFGECVFVDTSNTNNGSGVAPGVVFGGCGSGEGISSARACSSPNQYGLDFYTNHTKRVSVTNSGTIGIGTCSPSSTLCVVGCIHATGCINAVGCISAKQVSGLVAGVSGFSVCGVGVYGSSCKTVGVQGYSSSGCGVLASGGKVGVQAVSISVCSIPIVAKGASGQKANLQQWENSCGTVYAVINKAGSLGLGGVTNPHHVLCISGKAHASSGFSIGPCTCINTTLVVNGSMAAKTRCVSASGCLATTDYGVFASGAITLTLPPAKTQKGMMLFIKNTSTSTVTIKPGGTDTIEGASSSSPKTLGKQYDSLQLISNGTNEWFIVGSVKCGAVIS